MNNEEINSKFEEIEKRLEKIENVLFKGNKEDSILVKNEEIWDIEGENLNLLKTLGEGVREKTKNTALLVLLGYNKKLSRDKVLAKDLRRSVAIHKIPLENFGTYLNELIPQSIIRVGKTNSPKAEYKLTYYGKALAEDLLKEISKNESKTIN